MAEASTQDFADTLSSGIQDIAALLPLLGTDQCEEHVGSALDVGFLYAAATTLSIFGSLGIVKASFATLLATISRPFHGARWLSDAGFITPGKVSSLVTIAKGTTEYGAETNFRDLLVDKHIGDPELVSSIEWTGWRTPFAESTFFARVLTWNVMLVLTSALGSLISLTPYFYLISTQWDDPLAWLFPAFRAFGSFLCVVFVQLALQLRIRHIVRSRLLIMKDRKRNPHHDRPMSNGYLEDDLKACFPAMDARSYLLGLPPKHRIPDTEEMPGQTVNETDKDRWNEAASLVGLDWPLLIYQVFIAVGMAMTVAGYIGCFNLVGKSDAPHGPYVWVGLETFLSLVRTSLWGSNPSWDESAGLKLSLQLTAKEIPLPSVDEDEDTKGPDQSAPVPYFPLITTPTQIPFVENLTHTPSFGGVVFIAHPESDFLGNATSYTGPLNRFKADDISSLLYAIVGLGNLEKALATVVVFAHSRASWCLIFNDEFSWAVSSTYEVLPKTTTLLVTLGSVIKEDNLALSREVYEAVCSHSRSIAAQLFGPPQPTLVLRWNLSTDSTQLDTRAQKVVGTMTPHDEAYVSTMQIWKRKSVFMTEREKAIRQYVDSISSDENGVARIMHRLYLYLLETVILEMELCRKDHEFASARMAFDVSLPRRLAPEWIHAMNTRMTDEKRVMEALCPKAERLMWNSIWRNLQSGLELLRESGDIDKLKWMLAHIRTLREPLEQVQAPMASFGGALGNRSMHWIWARCSGAWASSETPANRGAYELEFHLTLLRLKMLLTRGYSAVPYVGGGPFVDSTRFFQPYLSLGDFSDYHIKGIQRANVLCTLQLRPTTVNDPHAREFIRRLASLPDSIGQLTTLDVTEVEPFPELPQILNEILKKHHNIISIICPHFTEADIEEIQGHLFENRKAWTASADCSGHFQHLVGFEPDDPFMNDQLDGTVTGLLSMDSRFIGESPPAPQSTMTADGQDIFLYDGRIECLVLFHAPSPGHVTIELNCAAQQPESTLTYGASGVEVVSRYKADTEDEWRPISTEPRQPGDESSQQLELDVTKRGSYEVRIRLSKSFDPDDFLHGDYVRLRGLPLVRFEKGRQR
ncbi:hypothetical protein PM082_010939 [Marasmius tenuissimus]|nr:hypothetical protein PM082_010939 [Marasmius tenuissimus]